MISSYRTNKTRKGRFKKKLDPKNMGITNIKGNLLKTYLILQMYEYFTGPLSDLSHKVGGAI